MPSRMNGKMIKHIWTMMKQSEDISYFILSSIFIIKSSTITKSQLVDKVSVNEVLLEFSKVYEINLGERGS